MGAHWLFMAAIACLSCPLQVAGLSPSGPTAALARRFQPNPSPWVSVNSADSAQTFTPTVVTTNGAVETISAPPPYLTSTSTWTLTISGQATTSTGLNPVATGTGQGEDGAFILCNNAQDRSTPICQPRPGSTVAPGHVYFVTWDPAHFANRSGVTVQVGATYGSGQGFVSEALNASQGYYAWALGADFLQQQMNTSLPVSLFLETVLPPGGGDGGNATSSSNDTAVKETGPLITVMDVDAGGGVSGPSVIAIALPLILAIVLLGIGLGLCIYVRRRRNQPPEERLSVFYERPEGYGTSPTQLGRLGSVSTGRSGSSRQNAFQLTDRESWTTGGKGYNSPGKHMFREEMVRQTVERR